MKINNLLDVSRLYNGLKSASIKRKGKIKRLKKRIRKNANMCQYLANIIKQDSKTIEKIDEKLTSILKENEYWKIKYYKTRKILDKIFDVIEEYKNELFTS